MYHAINILVKIIHNVTYHEKWLYTRYFIVLKITDKTEID